MKPYSEHVPLARAGFTLVELVVVVAMVGLLATMLAPTLARTKPNSASFQCQNNLRQLAFAWKMYADDNNGGLVYNRDGGNTGKSLGSEAWVAGWLDYTSSTDNTNTALLIDHNKYPYGAYLGPYIKTPLAFRCPADRSTAPMPGGAKPRARSISMNNFVGTGSRTWNTPSRYPLCTKFDQIKLPGYMFVFLDEREDSINDGCFLTDPDTRYALIDYPSSYHNNAGSFSFADGHSEFHPWKDRRTMPALQPGQFLPLNVVLPGDPDLLWLAQHAAGVAAYP
jgi:prepilin-type N-terminal cleavage/methylation domain-containing protein/prepilin-type processing-associated H-X9-DG protein